MQPICQMVMQSVKSFDIMKMIMNNDQPNAIKLNAAELLAFGETIVDAWNQQDLEALKKIYGSNAAYFDPLLKKYIKGNAILAYAQGIFTAFPDLELKVISRASNVDLIMFERMQCGTNTGTMLGREATGRYIEIPAVSVLKMKEGQLISHTDYWDLKQLMMDLYR